MLYAIHTSDRFGSIDHPRDDRIYRRNLHLHYRCRSSRVVHLERILRSESHLPVEHPDLRREQCGGR